MELWTTWLDGGNGEQAAQEHVERVEDVDVDAEDESRKVKARRE